MKTKQSLEYLRGNKIAKAKLLDVDVRTMRQLFVDGLPYRVLARIYGIDQSNVGYICRRKTWAHVK